MIRVGLTGGIASGKSTVADALAGRGAVLIDADLLAREVVEPGTPGLAAVRQRFGEGVVADGRLDRAALARLVFEDADARRDLEAIVHPAVRARARALEAAAPADAVVVHVIPRLVETGQAGDFDVVVVVEVDPAVQRERLVRRSGLSPDEAEARIRAQAARPQRLAAADEVLDNTGDHHELDRQVARLWAELARGG